ncbi:MAG: hypothetical protein MRY64_00735 [Hyphomonadaceae bacterium]|nr:hypothetical protein [Hyphomonadaceae bacterium]
MLKRHKLALVAPLAALLAGPALADGRDRTPPVGPTPLQPLPTITCPDGTVTAGPCPVQQTVIRPPAPQVHRVVQEAPAPSYDFSSFTGGVGSAIATGPVGGGGGVIVIGSGGRYSGMRSSNGHSSLSYSSSSHSIRFGGGGGGACAGF